MKKSQRLNVIVELNSEYEKKTLVALGATQTKKKALQTQLENLKNYHHEYLIKYQNLSQTGINISQLLEFKAFISKLEKAIDEQQQAIVEIEKELSFAMKNWERQRHKTKGLRKICDSALAVELKELDKREQNEHDERAARTGRGDGIGNA